MTIPAEMMRELMKMHPPGVEVEVWPLGDVQHGRVGPYATGPFIFEAGAATLLVSAIVVVSDPSDAQWIARLRHQPADHTRPPIARLGLVDCWAPDPHLARVRRWSAGALIPVRGGTLAVELENRTATGAHASVQLVGYGSKRREVK